MHKTILFLLLIILYSCEGNKSNQNTDTISGATKKSEIHYKQEKHLANIKQLTFGGDNAEAYFSFDDSKLVFQLKNPEVGVECDQIYVLDYNNVPATTLKELLCCYQRKNQPYWLRWAPARSMRTSFPQ